MKFKDDDTLWVKTDVIYWDLYDGDEYQWLGLDSVTCWDLNKEENRKKTRKGDYVEDLEAKLNKCREVLLEIHKTAEDSDWSRFVSFVESETGNILEEVFGSLEGENNGKEINKDETEKEK